MKNIVIATSNKHKVSEISAKIQPFFDEILSLADFPEIGEIVEDGNTIEENSFIKSRASFDHTKIASVADDTILEVDALNGAPGLYTARYAGKNATYEENMTKLLKKLDGIEDNATRDQDASEIKTLYEDSGNDNKNYIKTTYESNSDTNAFTDAEKTKLGNLGSLNALSDVDTTGVADNKILKYDSSVSKFIIADDGGGGGGGGSSTFTGLSDTPSNYGGAANKTLKINSAGNAVEFVTVTTSFADLTDTPSSLSGQGGKAVKVNSGGTALEFAAADVVDDTTPQLGGNLDVQANEITTSTTNGNIKVTPNGTGVVEIKGAGGNDGTLQLNCSANSHGVKIKSPAHSAGASYTLTLPDNDGTNGQALKTDGSGALSFGNVVTSQTEIISLYDQSGTPVQRFLADTEGVTVQGTAAAVSKLMFRDKTTAYKVKFKPVDTLSGNVEFTLPSADGTNGQFLKTDGSGVLSFGTIDLTNLSASNLTSGTIPDDRFPATLPTASAANLTYIPAANINGTLPALNASSLTNLTAANLQGALPAIDGSSLTGIDPTVANGCIYENNKTITSNFTTSTTKNSMSAGPITVDTGVTLTIPSGSTYTIV